MGTLLKDLIDFVSLEEAFKKAVFVKVDQLKK